MLVVICMVVQLTTVTHIYTLGTIGTQATTTLLEFSMQYFILLNNQMTLAFHLTHTEYAYAMKVVTLTAVSRTTYFQGVCTLEKHFNISAVTMGQRHGVAPAVIKGTVISNHHQYLLKPSKRNYNTDSHCVNLIYTMHSKNQQETLELGVEQARPDAGSFYYKF